MKSKTANKAKGHLLYVHGANKYVFRVYQKDRTFIDYDIAHCDLCVTINDADAHFYSDGTRNILDHAPETLGR